MKSMKWHGGQTIPPILQPTWTDNGNVSFPIICRISACQDMLNVCGYQSLCNLEAEILLMGTFFVQPYPLPRNLGTLFRISASSKRCDRLNNS